MEINHIITLCRRRAMQSDSDLSFWHNLDLKRFLSSFFTQSSCLAVFHDRFSDFEQELQQTLKLKVGAPLLISYITLTPLWGLNCIGSDARLKLSTWPLWRWGILKLRQELPHGGQIPLPCWLKSDCYYCPCETVVHVFLQISRLKRVLNFLKFSVVTSGRFSLLRRSPWDQCFGQSSCESFFLLSE